MKPTFAPRECDAFYRAAIIGLRALDASERSPRRLGVDADARWAQFAGALGPSDRMDLLLRDAAGTWGAAFSPAEAFNLFGLAEDEPFGPDWPGVSDDLARRLLAEPEGAKDLTAAAAALGIQPTSLDLPSITPATRLIAAGSAAVLALAQRFASTPGLSWSDQIVVVASFSAHRQFAALAGAILNAQRRTTLVRPAENVSATLKAAGIAHVDAAVLSPDAEPDAAAFAQRAAGGR